MAVLFQNDDFVSLKHGVTVPYVFERGHVSFIKTTLTTINIMIMHGCMISEFILS